MVPDWHNRPVIMQLALGGLAVYNLRPSDCTPVEEVNILWALEGGSHIRGHTGVLSTNDGFSWRTFEGVFSPSALRRIKAKMMAFEGLFRELGPRRGETVTRSCVDWWLLGRFAGWRTTPQWMHSARPPPPWNPYETWLATGQPIWVVKAIIKCSGEMQNDPCGKRLVGNFLEWCDTPADQEAGFLHHRWVLVIRSSVVPHG